MSGLSARGIMLTLHVYDDDEKDLNVILEDCTFEEACKLIELDKEADRIYAEIEKLRKGVDEDEAERTSPLNGAVIYWVPHEKLDEFRIRD